MALTLPLDGKITVTSKFGNRPPVPGVKAPTTNHLGTDLRAAVGTPARAPADGVMYAYRQSGRYYGPAIFTAPLAGNWLMTWHPSLGVYVTYAHLQATDVGLGAQVRAGQQIGRTGNSGGVAPHLHVGVWTRIGNTWTAHDPEQFFEFVPKTSAPLNPTPPPSEEDDMFTEDDRSILNANNSGLIDALELLRRIEAKLNTVAVDAGLARWATSDETAGLRRMVADTRNTIAALPGSTSEPVDAAAIAAEIGKRLSNG